MDIKNSFYKNLLFSQILNLITISFPTALARAAGILAIFATNVLIARGFNSSDAGIFFLAFGLVTFLCTFGRVGIDMAIVRLIAQAESNLNFPRVREIITKALAWSVAICFVLAFLLRFLDDVVAIHIFGKPALGSVLANMILCLPFVAIYSVVAKVFLAYGKSAASIFLFSGLTPLLFCALLLSKSNASISFAALLYVVGTSISAIISLFFLTRLVGRWWRFSGFSSSILFDYGVPIWRGIIASQIIFLAPLFFLGIWVSAENIAMFTVAFRISILMLISSSIIIGISSRGLAILSKENSKLAFKSRVKDILIIAVVVSIPILLGILFFSKQLLLFFGDDYVSGTYILIILTLGSFFNNLANILQNSLIMSGEEREVAIVIIMTAFLAVLAYSAMVPGFGIVGAGFVFLMSQLTLVIWLSYLLLKPKA